MSFAIKEKKIKTNFYLQEKNYRNLKRLSYELDEPRTKIIERALEKYIDEIDRFRKPIPFASEEEQKDLERFFNNYDSINSVALSRDFKNSETEEWETEYFNEDDDKWYNSEDIDTYWDDETDKLIVVKKK